jgi:hypothetical protein
VSILTATQYDVDILDLEDATLLPERETMQRLFGNIAVVPVVNIALAFNILTIGSTATATAGLNLNLWQ